MSTDMLAAGMAANYQGSSKLGNGQDLYMEDCRVNAVVENVLETD